MTVAHAVVAPPNRGAAPPAHIILVGLPGAGKTSVGRVLAGMLGRPFLDFDDEIERRTRLPVAEIFSRHGEAHFRKLELDLTEELATSDGAILAPGGGWAAVPGALALLRPPGRMIYLRVAPEVAILRMGDTRSRRPLLQVSEPIEVLRRLRTEREPAYLQADYVIDTDRLAIDLIAAQIVHLIAHTGESNV